MEVALRTKLATSAAMVRMSHKGQAARRPARLQDKILEELEELKRRVASLEQALEIVDELPWDDALDRGRSYFADNPDRPTTPDVLAVILETSVAQAADVCAHLEREGLVASR
jgi:hypothetical protein